MTLLVGITGVGDYVRYDHIVSVRIAE